MAGAIAALTILLPLTAAAADPTPIITGITPPAAATYTAGDPLNFTVVYSAPVTVAGGTPTFTLIVGSSRRFAYYASGSGTDQLVFRYTVQPGDNDANGIATGASALVLNGATMRSTANVDAELGFTSPSLSGVRIDTPPIVTAIRRLAPITAATAASTVTYRVSFSEPVTGVDADDFTLVKTQAAYGVIDTLAPVSTAEFDVTVTDVSGRGLLRLDLKASGTGIADPGGQSVSGGFTAGQFYAPLAASTPVGWGRQLYGRLGTGVGDTGVPDALVPTPLVTTGPLAGKYLVEVAAGGYHSVGLTADGLAYAWGRNNFGQLGRGQTGNRYSPQAVVTSGVLAGKTIVAVAAGGYHSLALDSAGKVYAWGRNDQGQLGDGTNTDTLSPVEVVTSGALDGKRVVAIAAGDDFSLALTDEGRVYAWGDGGDGQLGQGSFSGDTNVPVAVTVGSGSGLAGQTVIAIAAGSEHALALTTEGKVYAWGGNGHGQLGTNMFGTNRSSPQPVYHGGGANSYAVKTIVAIAAGWDHSIALTSEGRIYVWGENDHGQHGNNGTTNRNDPGLVSATGVLAGKSIVAITGGDSHTAALDAEGRVYAWGFNDYGQLGNGTSGTDTLLPVAIDTTGALAGKTVAAIATNSLGVFNLALAFDTTGPRIVAVAPPAAQAYRAGTHLDFTVTFNNAVTVTGTPKLPLTVGATARQAAYLSGTGTDTLVFRYTVQAGETDADGIATGSSLDLDGGTIQDAAALAATLTFDPPDTSAVLVDTTLPAAPTITSISDDTGASDSDRITKDNTLVFNGTAEAGSTVALSWVGGSGLLGTTTADGDGAWSFDHSGTVLPSATLPLIFSATATDAAGNVGPASTPFLVTIDTTAPAAPTIAITDDTGSAGTDLVTSDSKLVFSGTIEPGAVVELFLDGTSLGTATADGDGDWSLDHTGTSLAEDTYALTATATDVAGNTSTPLTSTDLVIDTTAPVITSGASASATAGSATAGSAFSGYTITATDANPSLLYGAAGLPAGLSVNPLTGVITGTPTAAGLFTVAIEVADAAGNIANASLAFTVNDPPPEPATVTLSGLNAVHDGTPKAVTVTTSPPGLSVQITYNGSTTAPSAVGSYSVVATIIESGYEGSATGTLVIAPAPPVITQQPASVSVPQGGNATFAVTATGAAPLSYQWSLNGVALAGETGATLSLSNVVSGDAGPYTVTVTNAGGSVTSQPAVLGVIAEDNVIDSAVEVGRDIVHPNGNVYDQSQLDGPSGSVTAEPSKVRRISFVDLNDDIIQVEFSGAGTLTVTLDDPSGPFDPVNYHQPGVVYMKGHPSIVITGADATTHLTVFSVGRMTAVNSSLFLDQVEYDGVVDLGLITITSTDGKFGSLRTGNVNYFHTRGLTGIYAPGIAFAGPVVIGDLNGFDSATALLVVGSADEVLVAGGDLFQDNGRPVQVEGIARLRFTEGTTSHSVTLPAQPNQARLEEDGVDVTDLLVPPN